MQGQSKSWRKLFNRHKKTIDNQKRAVSPHAKKPHSLELLGSAKDTGVSRDVAHISEGNHNHHRKNAADSDNGHATPSAPSALEDSSFQAEQNPPKSKLNVHNPLTAPPSTESDTQDDRPLWDRAYARLRVQKPDVVEEYEGMLAKTAIIKKDLPLNQTMRAIVDNRLGLMTSRQWKIRIPFRKDQMLVTELVDKIVSVVLKFQSIGSTVASLDPVHAGIPFAAICFLLPLITNASEERESSLKGLELVADLVDLHSEVEIMYLRQNETRLTKKFSAKLEHLYFEILDFLARAACFFDLSTIKRLAVEVLKREDWDGKLKSIKNADEDCRAFANAYHQQEQRTGILTIKDLIRHQDDSTQELLRKFNLHFRENEEIISWVSKIDVESAHGQVRAKLGSQYQNTGQWLRPRYHAWIKSPEKPTFWICGSVGTGKSSLISHVIEWHLEETQTKQAERVAYFYCSRTEGQSTSSKDVLRSLIAQLAWSPDGSEIASSVKVLHDSGTRRQDKLGPELLATLAARHDQTTVIIDALDECEDHSKLLFLLKEVSKNASSGSFKFFFSSRPNVNWLPEFPSWDKLELDAERELTSVDMQAYIRTQVLNTEGQRLLGGKNPELEGKLVETLIYRAQGMFRWVELQIAKFLSDHSGLSNSEDVEEALDRLMNEVGDPDLDRVYSEIYDINTKAALKSRAIAMRAFHWMMCAHRPLSLTELADVAAAGQSKVMKKEVNDEYILKICSNFIIADASRMAQFAHLSVREYLQKREIDGIKEFSQERSHNPVAETCLSYLMSHPIPVNGIDKFHDTPLGYSVMYWASHWQQAFENRGPSSLGKIYNEFIPATKFSPRFTDWIGVLPTAARHWSLDNHAIEDRLKDSTSPILAACAWGFIEILLDLSKTPGIDLLNSIQEGHRSGLTIACKYGQDDVVQLLLDNGVPATINVLVSAVESGHKKVVKQLLDNGAGVNEPDSCEDTAIVYAAKSGDCAIMALLLDEGADMNATVSYKQYYGSMAGSADKYTWGTALHVAARDGNLAMIKLLLDRGANIEAVPFDWGYYKVSPLDWAIKFYHEDVVEALIKKEGDVLGATASRCALQRVLHQAACDGNDAVALRLLEEEADANAVDEQGRTALHKVGRYGNIGVARLLIKYGADPRRADVSGRTPLHEAVDSTFNASGELVQLLLENGAEAEVRDTNQRTPLHETAKEGSATVMQFLLDRGADVMAKDDKNQTPLQEACAAGGAGKIRLLLQKGVDIGTKNSDGRTALHIAAEKATIEGVKLLLSQDGIDPNSRDKDGHTPLSLAMHNREAGYRTREEDGVVPLLLAHGSDNWDAGRKNGVLWDVMSYGKEELVQTLLATGTINVDEYWGGTLLHKAALKGYEPSVRLLLEKGAKMEAGDTKERTALHIAAAHGKLQIARLLLDKGANIEARDEDGTTPLVFAFWEHLNVSDPDTAIFDLLLERGADINARDDYDDTALHDVCYFDNETLLCFLLANGADVALKNKNGRTALHQACCGGSLATIRLLIEHGADKTARDNEGKTPLGVHHRRYKEKLEEIFGMKCEGSSSGSEDEVVEVLED